MAKKYQDPDSIIPEPEAPKVFISSKGVTIRLRPVSQFKLNSLRMSRKEVPAPTYTVKLAGGDEQEFALDAVSAASKGRMDEWNAYLAAKEQETREFSEHFTDLLIWDGVDVDVPGQDSEWQNVCNYLGIEVPENQVRRKSFYVQNELLSAVEDMGELTACIMEASHTSQEQVRKMRESFRTNLRRASDPELREEQEPLADS